MQPIEVQREAVRLLPDVLSELFEEPVSRHTFLAEDEQERGADFIVEAGERRWLVQIKSSSSPGIVADVAERLTRQTWSDDALPLLVVPFMTTAGAKAAAGRHLNWIDLSGNAKLRDDGLIIWVQGNPNRFTTQGRPASPFAPKSSRIARALLLDPERWWRQKDLADHTDLDPGRVSRVIRRLDEERLILRDGLCLRPGDPDLLLDAWSEDYRFDRHDIITGHVSGAGMELARELDLALGSAAISHAFTGLPAAWVSDKFAQFRVVSVYVDGDPRLAADTVELRRNERGANVQIIGPSDRGVFDGQRTLAGLPCVSPVQIYLDLGHLPERAAEAADRLREDGKLWRG